MAIDEPLYCKLFVNGERDREDLIAFISDCVGGTIEMSRVNNPDMEVDVRGNDDFKPGISRKNPDAFLFYRYYLDITQVAGTQRTSFISGIAKLLNAFWADGTDAVAACDFEDELPNRGGYNP